MKNICFSLLAALFLASQQAAAQTETAQADPRGFVVFSAAYSERYKETLGVEFVGKNLFGKRIDLRFGGQVNDLGHQWTASLSQASRVNFRSFLRQPTMQVGLSGQNYAWEDSLFQSKRFGIYTNLSFELSSDSWFDVKGEVYRSEISNVSASTSPLVAADVGRVVGSGVSFTYTKGKIDRLNRSGKQGFAKLDIYGLGGDAKWMAVSAGYRGYFPVGRFLSSFVNVEGGAMRGFGGYATRVTDRAFLTSSNVRGFAFGGVGPLDTNGTTITPLGGQKYFWSNVELGREVVQFSKSSVVASAFWDAGSVWDLPQTTGGFGPIDDAFSLRQSVGIALDVNTPNGIISIAFAKPIKNKPNDRIQELSLTFKLGF